MKAHDVERPLVGVVCDRFYVGEHDLHSVKHSYLAALMSVSRVSPVLVPASREMTALGPYLRCLSGLLFPGAASNVDPRQYGALAERDSPTDLDRDHIALELIREAARREMPFLAICRGFQEMNVAFGGTLFSDVHASGHSIDHLENLDEDLRTRYRYKHDIELAPGGTLSALTAAQRIRVNSLHRQGIDSLAPALTAEACSADGLIEACRLKGHDFAIGVQWHPEFMVASDSTSRSLFEAFGGSCRRFAARRSTLDSEE